MKIPKIKIDWGEHRYPQTLEIIKLDKGYSIGTKYFADEEQLISFIKEFFDKAGLL